MNEGNGRGLALLCDSSGMIRQVLRNDLGLADALPGRLFVRLVDEGSRSKALDLLVGVKTHAALWDWELNLPLAGGLVTLHFFAGQVGEQILIVGAPDGQFAAHLYEELLQVSNECTNLLRAMLKEGARREPEAELYDEISRLNNELVTMQRELVRQKAELERLNQEKNRFLGMAAHDLRNPLHVILNHSAFLLEEEPNVAGSQRRASLQAIYAASEFMSRLVDDLLDVAKIESGQLVLDPTATDVGELLARNVALNQTLASRKGITIDLHCEPLPLAIVDAAKLEQVLNNLIGNAVKFSPPGSRIEVGLTAAGPEFQITVRDQGPGISAEEQARLFQPFQRGRPGSAGEKSTGLGLAIAKRIVQGHGGRIWLESAVGQGTTVFVALPFEPDMASTPR